jgi:predicted TIM-barrel fold metal-dependent hydrolase
MQISVLHLRSGRQGRLQEGRPAEILGRMAIIDMHVHAFPDSLAPRAMAALQDPIDWKGVGDGTIADLLRSMDAAGVDASVVCNIATKPSQVEPIFNWCRAVASDRIIPFPSIHPENPDPGGWVRRFKDAGLRGVKLHPMYQEFTFDEPRMDPLYAAVAEAGLLLEPHCGYDIAFPGDHRADVERIAAVIRRHPSLRLICTHLGAWKQWDAVREQLAGRSVWFETSMSVSLLGLQATAEMIRAHGADRVMFGSDWPWTHQRDQLNLLRMLDLPKAQIEGILGGHAATLLGF